MKRLFAFGCSYTSYSWPTWANLLSFDYDEFYNWGLSGLGNRAIAERVAEANVRYQFNQDDTIIVQWSSHIRNDWWHQTSLPERHPGWKTAGSIFNYINADLYDEKWIKTFFFEPAYLMHTLNHISLTQQFLESIGCTWFMTSIGDIRNMGTDLREGVGYGEKPNLNAHIRDDISHAWENIPELMIYEKQIWKKYSNKWLTPIEECASNHIDLTFKFLDTLAPGGEFYDIHPSTSQHWLWLKENLKDKLPISENTMNLGKEVAYWIDDLHSRMYHEKRAFELAIAKRASMPSSIQPLVFPGRYEGF